MTGTEPLFASVLLVFAIPFVTFVMLAVVGVALR